MVSSRLNSLIAATVKAAKVKARKRRPNAALASNIVFAVPNLSEREMHQPKSPQGSWIFLNDTWVHPSGRSREPRADRGESDVLGLRPLVRRDGMEVVRRPGFEDMKL